jgi:hypothetical protein
VSNYKYTSDGKKVVVLGMLNNVESIVQEIFVTASGDEIPSGEKFTSKSLHDEPVISYAKKEEQKTAERAAYLKSEIDKLHAQLAAVRQKLDIQDSIAKSALASITAMPKTTLENLQMFLSGSVKFTVEHESYYFDAPRKFEDVIAKIERDYGREKFDSLRLLALYGDTKGNLQFRLSDYSDGSGGARGLVPFRTYEAALEFIKAYALQRHEAGRLSADDFVKCVKMGIHFNPDMTAFFEAKEQSEFEAAQARSEKEHLAQKTGREKKHADGMMALAESRKLMEQP